MSVQEIRRYRAKCDDCGALADLRDSLEQAAHHALTQQGWVYVADDCPVRLLCATCFQLRQRRESVHEANAKATVLDEDGRAAAAVLAGQAAKAAAFYAALAEFKRSVSDEAWWFVAAMEKLLFEERAKRGLEVPNGK